MLLQSFPIPVANLLQAFFYWPWSTSNWHYLYRLLCGAGRHVPNKQWHHPDDLPYDVLYPNRHGHRTTWPAGKQKDLQEAHYLLYFAEMFGIALLFFALHKVKKLIATRRMRNMLVRCNFAHRVLRSYHFYFCNAFLTAGAILLPNISIDFIMISCEGPPTSICAEKRVRPNRSCICRILSIDSLASPIIKCPLLLLPASYCWRW